MYVNEGGTRVLLYDVGGVLSCSLCALVAAFRVH